MAITTVDEILNALGNNYSPVVIDKASVSSVTSGNIASLWRATGVPAQAAIPTTTPAVPTNATTGAIPFTQQTAPDKSYLGALSIVNSNNVSVIEIYDRIAHMGGLVFNTTSPQTITGLDLDPTGLNPPAARLGAADYSDVMWFLEGYAAGGATASNATINVTYGDGTSGNLTVTAVGGTYQAARMTPLTPLIPTADQGKRIRRINSVTLSASTGTAGNFGFTCLRPKATAECLVGNKMEVLDWQRLYLADIENGSCLQLVMQCTTTNTGAIRGFGKIIHG